jgi:hypothetical protein
VFKAPYAGHVAALFDGDHTVDETMAGLPASPGDLFQASYTNQLRHPGGALRRAARANDYACLRWRTSAPIRMYAAHGDPEAVYANSLRCKDLLHATDITLTDVGDVDHIASLVRSVPQVATWFATLN